MSKLAIIVSRCSYFITITKENVMFTSFKKAMLASVLVSVAGLLTLSGCHKKEGHSPKKAQHMKHKKSTKAKHHSPKKAAKKSPKRMADK